MLKAVVHLEDHLLNPKTSVSQEPLDGPFSQAFGRQLFFDFLENPENEFRLRRFGAAMRGGSTAVGFGSLLTGKLFVDGRNYLC
jgi:hypothetical protein